MNIDLESTLARLGNDRELLLEFVQIFREDSPQRIDAIQRSFERGDAEAAAQAAHSMRGLASSLGATQVVATAQQLEAMASSKDLSDWPAVFENLLVRLAALDEDLREIEHAGVSEAATLRK